MFTRATFTTSLLLAACAAAVAAQAGAALGADRININNEWRFKKADPADAPMRLLYDERPAGGRGRGRGRGGDAATAPAPVTQPGPAAFILKPFIMPSANDLIADPAKRTQRPAGNPGEGISYIMPNFDDSSWRQLDLPHDWGVEGPYMGPGQVDTTPNTTFGTSPQGVNTDGATGRLPFYGVGWYRKTMNIPAADAGKKIYLDMDGSMSYTTVWLNGQLVGGWPFGYASFRLDLTPHIRPGAANTLAIRLDNPPNSSRWYPGGGIYRSVWLVKSNPVHVAHWGTFVTTPEVSAASAKVDAKVWVENTGTGNQSVMVGTQIYALGADGKPSGAPLATIGPSPVQLEAGAKKEVAGQATIANPKLWSTKTPNRYIAVTSVTPTAGGGAAPLDQYETKFGIRTVKFTPEGMFLNGEQMKMNGVCNHHDLGAFGSAVNVRALQRQFEILKEMGCNAIRTSHNPPTPELLEFADEMGFVVFDETFDTWRGTKTTNDYGRVFADWAEPDTRALVRRDRNHPSVVMWSIGNEVGEQGQGEAGAAVARMLKQYVQEEDPTRPVSAAANNAQPGSPFAQAMDAIGLNYQGSRPGRGPGQEWGNYGRFRESFPDKFVYGSETASTISSRGEYFFPVAPGYGAVSGRGGGQDNASHQMSSYDLYYPSWATSPDTEFQAQDRWPFVGGEFVWTGFDYIGEPTPWGGGNDPSRSSYFGIIDLAGFPKDRFYIYQAKWRPELPMAHILPHWNWPDRAGQVTPVHVYTSGDEGELFLNGKSLGRKKIPQYQYRLRWDDVVYEPGELRVVTYKGGREWATETMKTTGAATKLLLKPDRATIAGDGHDLSFVTLTVADAQDQMVPRSKQPITFEVSGPGEIVVTDNGDAADLVVFASKERKAFNGLALAVIKAKRGQTGTITVTAKSEGLTTGTTTITTR